MDALIVVLMLVATVIVHESAHSFMAIALEYKLKKFYLGIPLGFKYKGREYTTTIWKTKVKNVEIGLSWLILGGAVDFYDLETAPFWKMSLIAVVGPISNLLLAFFAVALIAGFGPAVAVSVMLTQAVFSSLGAIASGQVGLDQLSGPVSFVQVMGGVARDYPLGWLLVWCLMNIALFVTNLIPIPALDGGQILTSFLRLIFGKKSDKPIKIVSYTCLYLLCALMVFVFAKDIWAGLVSLFS